MSCETGARACRGAAVGVPGAVAMAVHGRSREEPYVVCPTDPEGHTTFYATAHVAEVWEVDAEGEFIEGTEKEKVVEYAPTPGDDVFTCATCGARAVVVE